MRLKPLFDEGNMKNPYMFYHMVTEDEISEEENNEMIKMAVEKYSKEKWIIDEEMKCPVGTMNSHEAQSYSVLLDKNSHTKILAELFYSLIDKTFDNVDVNAERERKVDRHWAYVSTKEKYWSEWHDHGSHTAINMVYYPTVPDKTATLWTLNTHGTIQEIELEDRLMLVFPGWMLHKPNPPKTLLLKARLYVLQPQYHHCHR